MLAASHTTGMNPILSSLLAFATALTAQADPRRPPAVGGADMRRPERSQQKPGSLDLERHAGNPGLPGIAPLGRQTAADDTHPRKLRAA
jgi:hypothetical protein